jgi:hypothetical protein
MPPGSLPRQHKDPKGKSGSYWQISDIRAMKSHTEYGRQECVADICRQIAAYKLFRKLTEQWIEVSIEGANSKTQIAKNVGSEYKRSRYSQDLQYNGILR